MTGILGKVILLNSFRHFGNLICRKLIPVRIKGREKGVSGTGDKLEFEAGICRFNFNQAQNFNIIAGNLTA